MKIQFFFFSIFLLITILIYSCSSGDEMNKALAANSSSSSAIDISNVKVVLPYSEGVELVEANCLTCHSLRYIETQPEMPRKAWDKIVKKMVKNYGAPISDTTIINQIIDYLATVKGKK